MSWNRFSSTAFNKASSERLRDFSTRMHQNMSRFFSTSPFMRNPSNSSPFSFRRTTTSMFTVFRNVTGRTGRTFSTGFKRATDWYAQMLESHPYKTQMVQSGILGFAGDYTTQIFEHKWAEDEGKKPKPWDFRRLAAVTAFGVFGMGPMGHAWYEYLDKFTDRYCKSKASMIGVKVFGDTFVFGPVCLWLFFVSVSIMEGIEWNKISRKLWRDFVPTYIVDYSMWPIVQGLNFHFVPVRHQLLVVNFMCYFDDIFLSYVQHNELPKIFQIVEDWWEEYYKNNLLKPGEKMEEIFAEDEDDD